jgi:hypothetical protein
MLNTLSKNENFLKKKFVLEVPFRVDDHINRHGRRVFGAEQLQDVFHCKRHKTK